MSRLTSRHLHISSLHSSSLYIFSSEDRRCEPGSHGGHYGDGRVAADTHCALWQIPEPGGVVVTGPHDYHPSARVYVPRLVAPHSAPAREPTMQDPATLRELSVGEQW